MLMKLIDLLLRVFSVRAAPTATRPHQILGFDTADLDGQ